MGVLTGDQTLYTLPEPSQSQPSWMNSPYEGVGDLHRDQKHFGVDQKKVIETFVPRMVVSGNVQESAGREQAEQERQDPYVSTTGQLCGHRDLIRIERVSQALARRMGREALPWTTRRRAGVSCPSTDAEVNTKIVRRPLFNRSCTTAHTHIVESILAELRQQVEESQEREPRPPADDRLRLGDVENAEHKYKFVENEVPQSILAHAVIM